jgi:hypothetical protein
MNEIRISPKLQLAAIVVLFAAVLAGIVAQLPEIRRYLNIERM